MRPALQTSGAEYIGLATCVAAIVTYDQPRAIMQHDETVEVCLEYDHILYTYFICQSTRFKNQTSNSWITCNDVITGLG